ncbi:MAG: UDP-glucose 4-epimerase GalE [Ruminococcaceae bacterium]|nr:UDP-glucose 4-epimerase GalE [Oscillospiraceae bacterium]
MKVLVTGGAGYIGTHTCVELLNAGHEIVVFDNFYNSSSESIDRVKQITGKDFAFYECDMLDKDALDKIFCEHEIDAVIHFAGYKAVGESVAKPIMYFHNNITGTLCLLEVMKAHNCKKIVFSSSATVYGDPHSVPIKEDFPLSATNPYGRTKLMIEEIMRDLWISDNEWSIVLLRYFNPVGAHESGLIGENPKGLPNNIMPRITQVAVGRLPHVSVFGTDYPTKDGTGVRDYIHVVDLAKGHVKALEYCENNTAVEAINLGTGNGYSVLELINTFAEVNNVEVPRKLEARRPGDIAACYADPAKAEKLLGWKAELGLEEMVRDSWMWQSKNPEGF